MKNKKFLIGMILFVSALIFTFLLGVFHQVGLNIKLWTYESRLTIAVLFGIVGVTGFIYAAVSFLWDDKDEGKSDGVQSFK